MCVPYVITAASESTADPSGAEAGAKAVIRSVFDLTRKHLSQFEEQSEVTHLNRSTSSDWITVSSSLGSVLLAAQAAARITDSVFSPAVLTDTGTSVPSFAEHFEVEQQKGSCQFRVRKRRPGAAVLDICGIAKGWVVDLACCRLLAAGFQGVCVDWGGDVKAVGLTPAMGAVLGDQGWQIGIVRPPGVAADESVALDFVLELHDAACATSGNFMQAEPHIRVKGTTTSVPASDIASVTVVHPSAATADALATYFFCELLAASSAADVESSLEVAWRKITSTSFGAEVQRVVVQMIVREEKLQKKTVRYITRSSDNVAGGQEQRCSIPTIEILRQPSTAATDDFSADAQILAHLRRSMRRMVAVVFVRVGVAATTGGDSGYYFGAALSSGGLISLLASHPILSSTPQARLFSAATLPKQLASCGFIFSVMRHSRLFNLLQLAGAQNGGGGVEILLYMPRIQVASVGSAEEAEKQHHDLVLKLNAFAGGASITADEMAQLALTSPVFECSLLAAPGVLPVIAGTHGVFALSLKPKLLQLQQTQSHPPPVDPVSDLRNMLSSSIPIMRAGRGYDIAPARPAAHANNTAPQLYPGSPTTCAVATRLIKGQFFGCTVHHVEFVAVSPRGDADIIQIVVPVHALSLAAFENFNLQPHVHRVKLHFFSEHGDGVSLVNWFSDPSFMSGPRTEHFMYLPSAATPEEELAYQFPGTAGKAGALYSVMCDVLHVGNLTLLSGGLGAPACILLLQTRRGGCKMMTPPSGSSQLTAPALTWG